MTATAPAILGIPMDKDPDRAARVYRRNRRIIWGTVAVVMIVVASSILSTVTFLMWWSTTPHAQE